MTEGLLERPGGRRLHFRVTGPESGHPVFYCHGVPGSSLDPSLPEAALARQAVRMIAIDRPGYGLSSSCAGYDFHAHTTDIKAVATHLGLHRFSLLGFSLGGVFALACASGLGARVDRVMTAGAPATALMENPLAHAGTLTASVWRQAQDDPAALPGTLMPLVADADTLMAALLDALSQADQRLLTAPDNQPSFRASLARAIRRGPEEAAAAMARDVGLLMQPWGFDPGALQQPVSVIHGTEDALLSTTHAEALASALPTATIHLMRGCGHYAALYAEGSAEQLLALHHPDPSARAGDPLHE